MSLQIREMTWLWREAKQLFEHAIGFSSDALHVLASVVLLIVAALLLRKPVSSWLPWLTVLALAIANEIVDLLFDQWPSPGMQYGQSVKDLLLTMALPTLLLITARAFPHLYAPSMPADRRQERA